MIKLELDFNDEAGIRKAIGALSAILGEEPKKETPKKETPKKETPKKETPKKEEPKEQTSDRVKDAPTKDAPTKDVDAKEEATSEHTIDEVRKLLSLKIKEDKDNKDKAKEKLADLGAPNISKLAPENYDELYEYLESL